MPADITTALFTADQVRRIDQAATTDTRMTGFALMQRAASAAFALLRRRWPNARRLLLLAGHGNNGGDAFLAGELALQSGFDVTAISLAAEAAASSDAARARRAFAAAGGTIVSADNLAALPDVDVIIDGLFGSGLSRPVDGAAANLIVQINSASLPVLALDLPSGLDADSGASHGPVLRAQATICFVAWKRGLFTGSALDVCGARDLATLDVPLAARVAIAPDARLLDRNIACLLPRRRNDVDKGDFGHVLAIGGERGMAGAIRLTGEAALRTGAGKVTLATREEHATAINGARPELMVAGVDDPQALADLLKRATVVALGPGLGSSAWSHALWDSVLHGGHACVLDADGLNLLARTPLALPLDCVLTPHPGEAARLLATTPAAIQADRFGSVRALACKHRAVVVLKGAGTLIADPDGHVAVCPWGNSGMASAGMGDLLTGVIAGLRAQGLSAWDAARLGVALHARAGDLAAADAPCGLLASDLLLPLRTVVNDFGA